MKTENIHWAAHYSDGTELREFEENKANSYNSIDRSKLVAFSLYKNEYKDKLITIHLEKGQRLIWRKREFIRPGRGVFVVHIAGWQQTVRGINTQSIAYVFPDGRIELGGKWKEGHPLFGDVVLLDQEKETEV